MEMASPAPSFADTKTGPNETKQWHWRLELLALGRGTDQEEEGGASVG